MASTRVVITINGALSESEAHGLGDAVCDYIDAVEFGDENVSPDFSMEVDVRDFDFGEVPELEVEKKMVNTRNEEDEDG